MWWVMAHYDICTTSLLGKCVLEASDHELVIDVGVLRGTHERGMNAANRQLRRVVQREFLFPEELVGGNPALVARCELIVVGERVEQCLACGGLTDNLVQGVVDILRSLLSKLLVQAFYDCIVFVL